MSRLTDLLAQVKARDLRLGEDLDKEFRALSNRLPFGLNFERHKPEVVELPLRKIRKGDKVRILADRGSSKKTHLELWLVKKILTEDDNQVALIYSTNSLEPDSQIVKVENLVVVAEFRDTIYPGLTSTGKVQRGGDNPFHTVINGENFHVLKALTYTHRGKVDLIYIDPPYNSGAKDWKYNNDYVEGEDLYRHSKWLAMIERRLMVAKELLNPSDSVLIVTIDEKEYLRLGLLLEQLFPETSPQMVSSVINRKGIVRTNEFTRTNEFIFILMFGNAKISPSRSESNEPVRWASLQRTDIESRRGSPKGGQSQFYPIFVNKETGFIEAIGDPIPPNVDRKTIQDKEGCITVWPVKKDGIEMNWGLVPSSLLDRLKKGFVKAVVNSRNKKPTLYYLTSGLINEIESGDLLIKGYEQNGAAIVEFAEGKSTMPTTQWDFESHSAQEHGKSIIKAFLPDRSFDFPKSLYAVEDVLRLFIREKPKAIVLDFFAGSGTTAHAVMRINRQDNGQRQSISITNNEVGVDEEKSLIKAGLRPGDKDWEKWGICEYITKPRVASVITGKTVNGEPIKGDYKFLDEFPFSEGLEQNAEFFTLTYEAPISIGHNRSFERIAPLLWLRAGGKGVRIDSLPIEGWAIADTYALLVDIDLSAPFIKKVNSYENIRLAYIVCDDNRRFQAIARCLNTNVEPVRLYESYLTNFSFTHGE